MVLARVFDGNDLVVEVALFLRLERQLMGALRKLVLLRARDSESCQCMRPSAPTVLVYEAFGSYGTSA